MKNTHRNSCSKLFVYQGIWNCAANWRVLVDGVRRTAYAATRKKGPIFWCCRNSNEQCNITVVTAGIIFAHLGVCP